ncbi:cytochrome P450 [Pseudahrensia aquimaris]|uniref:Cytochrome P450 n=1 Tax=Pseudahrensia aquimaris TaxID=744461 RepID=A0ABW3FKI6_9HYPH
MPTAPVDETIVVPDLLSDPYAIYRRLRADTPVCRVPAINRTMLTRFEDTKAVKDNWELFSSDDPGTPMKPAFQAHTLMRKDGAEHSRERNAMAEAFAPGNIKRVWLPLYETIADEYLDRLPKGEVIDLFADLAAPISARCLAHLLGLTNASDADLCRWSQTLIDGAGNFAWLDEPFALCDAANIEINAAIDATIEGHKADHQPNAISAMLNLNEPMPIDVIRSNIKIAIGGGINEPRDALCTVFYGLLTSPDQFEALKADPSLCTAAFEEAIRWVAPIQVSSRRAVEDTQIRGIDIAQGEVVMTVQASANHDEEHWENPHVFDMTRTRKPHQAFGNGPHFCLGTHIARRMIANIIMPKMLERFPNMELAGDVKFWGFGFRGPLSLPLKLN